MLAWLDEAEMEEIRKRFTAEAVPACRVCGNALSVTGSGHGGITWACSGLEDDPQNPGQYRYQDGRAPADEHYVRSRFHQVRIGDDQVLRLLAEVLAYRQRFGRLPSSSTCPGEVAATP